MQMVREELIEDIIEGGGKSGQSNGDEQIKNVKW